MPGDEERFDPNAVRPAEARDFVESLQRRGQAARGLEEDLLTEVSLLYGSPGGLEPGGDPGIILARVHREELLRRNNGGALNPSGKRSEVVLPFERATGALAILLFLLYLFGAD